MKSKTIDNKILRNVPFYNSRIIRAYVNYIRDFYPFVDINAILRYSNIEIYQLEDDDCWFTQEQIDKFHEILSRLIDDEDLPRKVGRYATSPDIAGYFRNYVIGLLGPVKAYAKISELAANFVRSSRYECKILAKNKVEINVTPNPGTEEKFFQCQNRIGYFEAIPLLFGYPLPEIEHPECIFKGGKSCRYLIKIQEKQSSRFQKLKNYLAAVLIGVNGILYLFAPTWLALLVSLSSFISYFVLSSYSSYLEKKEILSSLYNLQTSVDAIFAKLNAHYNHLLLTMEIAHILSTKNTLNEVFREVVNILQNRLDFDRGAIFLADPEKTKLNFAVGYGYTEEQRKIIENTSFNLRKPESKGVFVRSFWDKKPFLVSDIDHIKEDLSLHSLEFAKIMGAKAFICCPILYQDEPVGVIVVDNVTSKRPLVQKDVDLLSSIARELGIWIENARLMEAKHRRLLNLIQVLASSLDARDPLTHGHSQRVAEYAYGIAKELGLSDEDCEMIKIAALLHDYGKIAIPDAVLRKNGRLSHVEFEYIKKHAQKTREILDMVGFDGAYAEIPKIAGSHHERFDGSGYPDGLRGDQIPLGGRILAVADVFDALTSPRPYREAYTPEEALKIITTAAGTQFDPEVVKAFIRYYQKTV
ncbi:MAG: HD domain-containing protein [Candidatus Jordarchaeaceae archaeon]